MVEQVLASAAPPGLVDGVAVSPYVDHAGEDSLLIEVFLSEDVAWEQRRWAKLEPIEYPIRDALIEAGNEPYPYIWYRKRSELLAEDEDVAA